MYFILNSQKENKCFNLTSMNLTIEHLKPGTSYNLQCRAYTSKGLFVINSSS